MTIGVCSPSYEVHHTQILGKMDKGIVCGRNSGDDRTEIVGTYGISLKENDSQGKNTHITNNSNNPNGGIITNNKPTTSNDPKSTTHHDKHKSEGESLISARNDEQAISVEVPS